MFIATPIHTPACLVEFRTDQVAGGQANTPCFLLARPSSLSLDDCCCNTCITCMWTYGGCEARRALSEFCWAAALSAARSLPGAFLSARGLSVALSSGSESNLSVLLRKRVGNWPLHLTYWRTVPFLCACSLCVLLPCPAYISFSPQGNAMTQQHWDKSNAVIHWRHEEGPCPRSLL